MKEFAAKIVAQDKLLHYIGGQLLFCFFRLFVDRDTAVLCAAAVGILKEIFLDAGLNYLAKRRGQPVKHTVDFWDAAATAAGGASQWAMIL